MLKQSKEYQTNLFDGVLTIETFDRQGALFDMFRYERDRFESLFIPDKYKIDSPLYVESTPAYFGQIYRVKIIPKTESEWYMECLEFFIGNLSTNSDDKKTVQTSCGKIYLKN